MMFCPRCGNEILENQKFCSECGNPIPVRQHTPAQPVRQNSSNTNDSCISEYIDNYISKATTFTSASSLINGAQPLRFTWMIIAVLCILSLFVIGPAGVIVGLLVSFIVIRLTLLILMIARSSKKYSTMGCQINSDVLDDLAIFLENNLDPTFFTAWQRGNPVTLGILTADLLVIECLFNNKTYHRIVFDPYSSGTYKIETSRATVKERLKDGGDRNPRRLYRSDYVVRPILEAATKYYFQNVMRKERGETR